MFEFFDKVISFFETIGEIIAMGFKAITGGWEIIDTFSSDYISPITTELPNIFGVVIGGLLITAIVVGIAILIWKVVT